MLVLQKIDNAIFAAVERIVKRYVKKNGGKKHKYDLFLAIKQWEIGYWSALFIWVIALSFKHHFYFSVALFVFVALIVIFFLAVDYLHSRELCEMYRELWINRKNPDVYNSVKLICKHAKEETLSMRKINIVMEGLLMSWFLYANPLVMPTALPVILRPYISCVFDFDEPEKKEKEKRESLTELAGKLWGELVKELSPKGI